MAYRNGNRDQIELFPPSIEDYVAKDHPVRAYDAFVEALDFNELGIVLDDRKVGCLQYNPKTMLKLLVYGYSYGFRSSRKLERAVNDNFSFIWLTEGLKPDHKTIGEFRRKNKSAIVNALKQCARLCIKLDLIAGNTLFVDGSKIRANASLHNTWTKEKCARYLKDIDKHIESIISECEAVDEQESNQSSFVKMKEALSKQETLKSEVQKILKELKEQNKKSINTTDPESTRIRSSIHGSNAGYNSQIVVDEEHSLIVNADVVGINNDVDQFAEQINQANETLQHKCDVACADSGYWNTPELQKIDAQDIKVIVPSKRQASDKEPTPFGKEHFQYNSQGDCFICPEGNKLEYSCMNYVRQSKVYAVTDSSLCTKCQHFGICTNSPRGRVLNRPLNQELRQKFEAQYVEVESQAIYKLRKQKVEHPFGHIKHNLKLDAFLLRGRNGAKAEMSLLTSCFNMARMISILGVKGLIQEFRILTDWNSFWFSRNSHKFLFFMSKNVYLN